MQLVVDTYQVNPLSCKLFQAATELQMVRVN